MGIRSNGVISDDHERHFKGDSRGPILGVNPPTVMVTHTSEGQVFKGSATFLTQVAGSEVRVKCYIQGILAGSPLTDACTFCGSRVSCSIY